MIKILFVFLYYIYSFVNSKSSFVKKRTKYINMKDSDLSLSNLNNTVTFFGRKSEKIITKAYEEDEDSGNFSSIHFFWNIYIGSLPRENHTTESLLSIFCSLVKTTFCVVIVIYTWYGR
jgi:hypothetical protein